MHPGVGICAKRLDSFVHDMPAITSTRAKERRLWAASAVDEVKVNVNIRFRSAGEEVTENMFHDLDQKAASYL
jgi:hypothetical protein